MSTRKPFPKPELFGGYSLAREDAENVHGFAGSLHFNLSKWLAIGVETSRYKETDHDASITRSSYLLGPRFSKRGGRIVPYVYALGGIEHTKSGVEVAEVSISYSESEGAVAFGGGFEIELSHKWALALKGDDLLVRTDGKTHGTFRFGAGVVFYIGEK